jgi:hypothetical protein
LVVQVGESPELDDGPEMWTHHKNRAIMTNHLAEIGFKSIHMYGQAHGGYTATWNNLLSSKSEVPRVNWYRNEAEVNLEMQRRSVKSKSGSPVFHYFDGATMQFFQMPSKRLETVFCRQEPIPPACLELRGYDPEVKNADISSFEVKTSGVGENAGRGLFAKTDIPKGTYVTIDTSSQNVYFSPSTFSIITEMEEILDDLRSVDVYMHGYGYQSQYLVSATINCVVLRAKFKEINTFLQGGKEVAVDSSITTFANHGCKGSYNIGESTGNLHEFSADVNSMPFELDLDQATVAYNPVEDRHHRLQLSGNDITLRDIVAGEEVLDNYLFFIGHSTDWEEDILSLQAQCTGAAGEITEYEAEEE